VSFSFILIGLVVYNTREALTAGKEQSPFTIVYWKSYCNSLLCEWRCICRKSDLESAPLLNVNGDINYNTVNDDDLAKPSLPKDDPLIKSITVNGNIDYGTMSNDDFKPSSPKNSSLPIIANGSLPKPLISHVTEDQKNDENTNIDI